MEAHFLLIGALAAFAVGQPFAAAAQARVDATMVYGGTTMKLDHVLVVRHGNEENAPDPPELRIFLSDRDIPLTVAAAANTLTAQAYARQGNFSGVVIVADPRGGKPDAVTHILHAPGIAAGGFASVNANDTLQGFKVAGGRASATVVVDTELLKVTGSFDAPVAPNPITQDITGAAALQSAPAVALLACTQAIHAVDMDAMARTNTAARMQGLIDFRKEAGEKVFAQELKSAPDAAATAKTLKRVIVRADNASVALGDGSVAELVLENGVWKCN